MGGAREPHDLGVVQHTLWRRKRRRQPVGHVPAAARALQYVNTTMPKEVEALYEFMPGLGARSGSHKAEFLTVYHNREQKLRPGIDIEF